MNTTISSEVIVEETAVNMTVSVNSDATGLVIFEMGDYNISVTLKEGKAVLNYILPP